MRRTLFNQKSRKDLRSQLRKQPTRAETMLWYRIKNNQLSYKFRRQHGIGKYVVDFFCPQLKLIVEIDGGVHFEDKNILADKEREKYLKNLGLRIIRYNNLDITKNIDNVLNNLIEVIKTKE